MHQFLQVTSRKGFANLGEAPTTPSTAPHVQCLLPLSDPISYLLPLAHSVLPTLALLFFQLPGHSLCLTCSPHRYPHGSLPLPLCSNDTSSEKPSLTTLSQIAPTPSFPPLLALLYCSPENLSSLNMIYLLVHMFIVCLSHQTGSF